MLYVTYSDIFHIWWRIGSWKARGKISLRLRWLMMVLARASLSWWRITFASRCHSGNCCSHSFGWWYSLTLKSCPYCVRESLLFDALHLWRMLNKIWWNRELRIVKIWKIFSECSKTYTTPRDYRCGDTILIWNIVLKTIARCRWPMSCSLLNARIRQCMFDFLFHAFVPSLLIAVLLELLHTTIKILSVLHCRRWSCGGDSNLWAVCFILCLYNTNFGRP